MYSQEIIFIFFIIIGLILGIVFDFFRVLRKEFKTSDFLTFIEDIVFIVISILLITIAIIKLNSGIIRFYLFIGILFGIIGYSLTIRKICVIIFYVFMEVFKYFCRNIIAIFRKKGF